MSPSPQLVFPGKKNHKMDRQIGSVNVPQSLDLEVLQDGLKSLSFIYTSDFVVRFCRENARAFKGGRAQLQCKNQMCKRALHEQKDFFKWCHDSQHNDAYNIGTYPCKMYHFGTQHFSKKMTLKKNGYASVTICLAPLG